MSGQSVKPCPARLGEACEWQSRGAYINRSATPGPVSVEQCRHCGHGRSLPPLPDVSVLYAGRASQDFQPGNRGLGHAIKRIAFRRQARLLLRQLGEAPGSMLDFGCGSGQFTRELGNLTGEGGVTGSDFFAEPPAELAGRLYMPLVELTGQGGQFDVVIAMHVLEHDDDVKGLLQRIIAPVRRGGTVVIEVPNVHCFGASLFGRFWDAWYLPYHRHHFTRRSLVSLLEANGLDVVAVHGVVVPTMGRTFANLLGRKNTLPMLLAGIVAHPFQLLGELLTGEPSALRAIARKR